MGDSTIPFFPRSPHEAAYNIEDGPQNTVGLTPHWCNGNGLFVIFGEHQVMAQPIAKRVLISPLINKDFPVRLPLLARGNLASVNLNHQK